MPASADDGLVQVTRLLLVDDNPAMLQTLVEMLDRDFTIAGTLSTGESVIQEARDLDADVILLDISLGDTTGFEVAERLRESGSKARIVFLSVHENPAFVQAGLQHGAYGYVFKSNISRDLVKAITAVSHGEHFLPHSVC
jgi:DNA-binding NarL/FixJ family response regulator